MLITESSMSTQLLTIEQFHKVLPSQVKKSLSQDLIDKINQTITDPVMAEQVRDNILGYAHVMRDGKFKIEDYVNAVRYVSFKLMGDSNIAAYIKTFPDRYQTFLANNTSDKDIASYVTSYNKNKLVNLVFEQTLIPTHVLNADLYQKALNVQAELMIGAKSEKVRTDAANSLLTQLKPPETTKIKIDVSHTESSAIAELREATMALAAQQRDAIRAGAITAGSAATSRIIEGTCEDV